MNGVERSNDGVVLKSCPFCGGKAILESDVVGKGKELWYASCKSDCVTQYGYSTTKERAIEKWNTRKPIERVIERLEKESNFFRGEPMGALQKAYYCMGVEKAIEIIKEELM